MSKLYIVPTPIGNLDDITLRAIKVLQDADFILAEDTRTTSFLLKHLGIEKRLYSHHKFNEHATAASLAQTIGEGHTVALVSDAGTPGISDPGFLLVRTCVEAGIEVETLPGATAFVPAIVQSGFPWTRTMIFYESPFRVVKCLEQFAQTFGGDRQASVSRELTKKFEQTVRGTLDELIAYFTENEPRGEFVIVVAGRPKSERHRVNRYGDMTEPNDGLSDTAVDGQDD